VALVLLAGVVIGSSIVLAAFAALALSLPLGRLPVAGAAVLEFAGLWIICLAANLVLGIVAIVLLRHLAAVFVSIYVLNDLVLVVLAALQAAGLWAWWTIRSPRS
jgi:hypothetical protein